MDEIQDGLTIDDLAERVDVPVRTIRFYIAEGLLPGPGSRGRSATYGEEHVVRLRLIRRLADQRVPLAKIAELVEGLTLDEARALLAREERRTSELQAAEESGSPRDYVTALLRDAQAARSHPPGTVRRPDTHKLAPALPLRRSEPPPAAALTPQASEPAPYAPTEAWQRWELAPGVELHARADALARYHQLIQRLLSAAGVTPDTADE